MVIQNSSLNPYARWARWSFFAVFPTPRGFGRRPFCFPCGRPFCLRLALVCGFERSLFVSSKNEAILDLGAPEKDTPCDLREEPQTWPQLSPHGSCSAPGAYGRRSTPPFDGVSHRIGAGDRLHGPSPLRGIEPTQWQKHPEMRGIEPTQWQKQDISTQQMMAFPNVCSTLLGRW